MQMCIVLRCIAAHNWQRPSISQLKVSTIQTKDLKDSFFFSFTEKIALKTTMLRSQFRKVCKIIMQGLGYLVLPSEGGGGEAVRSPSSVISKTQVRFLQLLAKADFQKNSKYNHTNIIHQIKIKKPRTQSAIFNLPP